MSDVERGRYHGDYRTELLHNPSEDRPFRVLAWKWDERGGPEGGWDSIWMGFLNEFDHSVNFRTLRKALEYRSRIRLVADHGYYSRRLTTVTDKGFVAL